MIVRQSDLFDARVQVAALFLGLSLWCELKGQGVLAEAHARSADQAYSAFRS